MATEAKSRERVIFGEYELDCRTSELRRNGTVVRLQPQPAKVLSILVNRAGEIVTREELAEQVWGSDTHVDFEHGLNFAIRKIRSVLEDDPEQPRYLETLPKRGYRFIAKVSNRENPEMAELPDSAVTRRSGAVPSRILYSAIAAALVVAAGLGAWHYRRQAPAKVAAPIQSVAVLPLRNLSNDPEQEYFSDGMTDELITDLAKSGGFRVISHTSVERFKDTKTPLPEIAKQLGVDAIIEGTVMRSRDHVRITAQLIDARSDQHLWADSYERNLRDVFRLQDEVARRIAIEIGTNLSESQLPLRLHEVSPAVHEAYLRGNFYWDQLSCDGFNKARGFFEQAAAQDPEFARAYLGMAESYFTLADWGCSPERDLIAKSRAALQKALELDPSLGEAHAWLGKLAFFYDWDFPKAESELKRGIELSPNYPEGHTIYAVFLVTTGKRDAGLLEMQKAHALDPISQLTNLIRIVVLYLARDYDAAIEQGRMTLELYPQSWGATIWLGSAYEKRGLHDEALSSYLKAKELRGARPNELSEWQRAFQSAGIHGYWQKELQDAEKKGTANACWFANTYAHLGDKAKALDFLDRSVRQHCSGPHMTFGDPVFDDFRGDPRYKELLRRVMTG